MNGIQIDLMTALPEIIVVSMAMVVLLLDLFIKPNQRGVLLLASLGTLAAAAYATFSTHHTSVGYAFAGMMLDDPLSDVLKLMMYTATAIMLVYTRQYITDRGMMRGEYYALVLFALLGMMIMVSGQSYLTLYIGLELLSLCMYTLVAMDRDNPVATEAAMKYFVLGALASGMLLYGMSMLYGVTGSLDINAINNALMNGTDRHSILVLGLVFLVAGVAFKLGAVPFQMWVPDVYHGAPTAVTMFIGSVPKFAGFALTIRLLAQSVQVLAFDWQEMLAIMSVLSIVIGNVTAIAQTNIKRMLAYSTISHIGYLLLGLMSASMNGYISALVYISAYVMMTLAGFGMILLLTRQGFESDSLDDLKGLSQRSPWFALMMLITMFSMAGVPPTLGFYAKFSVLQAAFQAGFVWLVVFAVLMAVVGAFYYLRIVKLMYFDEPSQTAAIISPIEMKVLLSLNALALLVVGLKPDALMQICAYAMITSIQ